MLRVGIIRCGTIGSGFAITIEQRFKDKVKLVAICDVDKEKAVSLANNLSESTPILPLDELIHKCDLVVEAASVHIASYIAREALLANKDVMIMNIGGLFEDENIFNLTNKNNYHVYMLSGAIYGLDSIKNSLQDNVSRVTLTTYKPSEGYKGGNLYSRK